MLRGGSRAVARRTVTWLLNAAAIVVRDDSASPVADDGLLLTGVAALVASAPNDGAGLVSRGGCGLRCCGGVMASDGVPLVALVTRVGGGVDAPLAMAMRFKRS